MRITSRVMLALAKLGNALLVKSKLLPTDPVRQYGLDPSIATFYVARLNAYSDLAALDAICRKLGLPKASGETTLGNARLPSFIGIQNPPRLFSESAKQSQALAQGQAIFQALRAAPGTKVQIIPVTILWGRAPGKEKPGLATLISGSLTPSWFRKFFVVLFSGRNNFVRISRPIEINQLLNDKADVDELPHKLLRVARVHFRRQKLAATGPKLPTREQLFNGLLASPSIKNAIAEEAKSKGLSHDEARREALKMLDEIAANYSDAMVRVADRILTWLWTKLYNGIDIRHVERVHELTDKGHEIIYVPCHRSHMDYLLLTYVIYHQGLVPPHIAAGVNLNFFPAGGIFRRSGAFFIRRSFAGNKLYSAVFKEYLSQLFIKGYSVKYYTEGGRSRTGRLLPPKTGMLAMSLQAMLRGIDRPISIVPVYIGYEHVMEINTYLKELAGSHKKNESIFGVFKAIKNLKNYGRGYLSFAEPINVNQFLNEHQPDWREAIHPTETQKPAWLNDQVAVLADKIMTNINSSAALNAVNLLSLVLLSAEQFSLSKTKLLAQLEFYLALQKTAPYHRDTTQPTESAEALLEHALTLKKFDVYHDSFGDIVTITEREQTLVNYYKNNVLHLFAVPAVIAQFLLYKDKVTVDSCFAHLEKLYPLFADEWFLNPLRDDYIADVLTGFEQQGLVTRKDDLFEMNSDSQTRSQLELLGRTIQLTLERYAILSALVLGKPDYEAAALEADYQTLAGRLGRLHGIKSPEFFDAKVLASLVHSMKSQGLLTCSETQTLCGNDKLAALQHTLVTLLPARVWQSIADTVTSHSD
ncbi:glycerol-3-phosphate 1-O-acyltransferase PlsB [Pseudoalteromonas fenneropenaei]|uniref:Glycerol-3-phosphate acyltransferase n=1 Tax=Pseudoalteromonas fenneropenaei TaxID=1737459 RepID=A0ABV7CQC5_9GAMM